LVGYFVPVVCALINTVKINANIVISFFMINNSLNLKSNIINILI
jgi:hypothetical protein